METCNLTEPINQSFTPDGSDSTDVIVSYTSTPDPTDDPELPRDMLMWATSFAEERMNDLGENPLTNTRMHPLYDEAGVTMDTGVVPGDDNAAHYLVGNQPGFNIQASGYQRKFTIAHEYGHLNTFNAHSYVTEPDINYCYDENTYPAVMNSCASGPDGHDVESAEWNAAAATEGVATWYSVATWHDIDLDPSTPASPNWTTAGTNIDNQGNSNSPRVPRAGDNSRCNDLDFFPTLNCPVGVANEWDWTSLFQVLRRDTGMSLKKTFQLLAIVHSSGNWVPDGPNDDFFDEVDLVAQQIFTTSEYQVWQTVAVHWEVDQ